MRRPFFCLSLHFGHSVHGGHSLAWALLVSPHVCDRATGHISAVLREGGSWPGRASQEETRKSAPLLPSANLGFPGPKVQAQPTGIPSCGLSTRRTVWRQTRGDAEDTSHSLSSPLVILCQQAGSLVTSLCHSGASPSHGGQTRELGGWDPTAVPPAHPGG